jgi:hypothetical protein
MSWPDWGRPANATHTPITEDLLTDVVADDACPVLPRRTIDYPRAANP